MAVRDGPTRGYVLAEYAEERYAEGSPEAKLHAAEAWASAAQDYASYGYELEAGLLLTTAAGAFREAGEPHRGIQALEDALNLAIAEEATGAGWGAPGSPEAAQGRREQADALLEAAKTELRAAEVAMPAASQVTATITSTPPGANVMYRRFVETESPLSTVTTDAARSLDPAMYLFVMRRPDGTVVERVADCWINCLVEF